MKELKGGHNKEYDDSEKNNKKLSHLTDPEDCSSAT